MPFSAPYKRGSGKRLDEGDIPTRFERYGVVEIKRALDLPTVSGKFGWPLHFAVKKFQRDHGLIADGVVGRSTLMMLFAPEVGKHSVGLPDDLLHAIITKESFYDPGAYYENVGSLDRGMCMLNSRAYPELPDAEAVVVPVALEYAAKRLKAAYSKYMGKGPERRLECTIASYNSPVGADALFRGEDISDKLRDYIADVKSFMGT
jgi:hypothetical protein